MNNLMISTDQIVVWRLVYLTQNFLLTLIVVPFVVGIARKYELLYNPVKRSSHSQPIPALGGIAIFIGFVTTFILINNIKGWQFSGILIACTIIFVVGLLDDLINLRAIPKLLIFIGVAIILAKDSGLEISNLRGFFGIHQIDIKLAQILTVFVIVFILNAINLMDGIDGLASGLGIVILGVFSVTFYQSNQIQFLSLTLPLLVSLLAFLIYNIWGKKYKIFMGDSGSLLLGLVIAISAIQFLKVRTDSSAVISISPVSVLSLLIVPVFDMIHVFSKRILAGNSPFTPDKTHIHHTLLKFGFCHKMATAVIIAFTIFAFILSQVLLTFLSEYLVLVIMIGIPFTLWNLLEGTIRKNPRKYVISRNNHLKKRSERVILAHSRRLENSNSQQSNKNIRIANSRSNARILEKTED